MSYIKLRRGVLSQQSESDADDGGKGEGLDRRDFKATRVASTRFILRRVTPSPCLFTNDLNVRPLRLGSTLAPRYICSGSVFLLSTTGLCFLCAHVRYPVLCLVAHPQLITQRPPLVPLARKRQSAMSEQRIYLLHCTLPQRYSA